MAAWTWIQRARDSTTRFDLRESGSSYEIDARREGTDVLVDINGKKYRVKLQRTEVPNEVEAQVDERQLRVYIEDETERSLTLSIDGERITFEAPPRRFESGRRAKPGATAEKNTLKAPMPGRIVSVLVARGEEVASGAPVAVMESMKMETTLLSDRKARVEEVLVKAGEAVRKGQPLVRFSEA